MCSRRTAVAGALVVSLTVVGCASAPAPRSSGTADSAGRPSAPVATASVDDFCNSLDDLNSTAQQVGLDRRLAAVSADLRRSAAKANDVLAGGVPATPGVEPFLGRLVSDLQNISRWVQTSATQADLDADRAPSGVRRSIDDMGYDFRQLQQWSAANCKDQSQGDGH